MFRASDPARRLLAVALALVLAASGYASADPLPAAAPAAVPGGQLRVIGPDGRVAGDCPLRHTDVSADVAGFFARVRVKQVFHNPSAEPVEAVYTFPLPHAAAVNDMVLTTGDRRIAAKVKPRDEARRAYDDARTSGRVAALLDQERPNVFTQSVANIAPGAEVVVEIAYDEVLRYEDGWFELTVPTVVGPRYVPGVPTGQEGEGIEPDRVRVPDAARVSPPVAPAGTRAGHDLGITVRVDAGMPIREVECRSHATDVRRDGDAKVAVTLKNQQSLPNKDFVLRYRTATDTVGDALLTHHDARGGFFTLIFQPPARVPREQAVGRELIFVLDTSGSMEGYPIRQAQWVIEHAIGRLGPQDTFNLITFAGHTRVLWDAPRPATEANRREAVALALGQTGGGGTEMMAAIEAALKPQPRPAGDAGPERMRVVAFLTDGLVGNDFEIIDAVRRNAHATRVFAFGIGDSVNRFLLDGISRAGRGEAQYVQLIDWAERAAKQFYERIDAPVLADVSVDWGDLPVAADDVYPRTIPDLWSHKPLVLHGRLKGDPKDWRGTVTLRGRTAAGPFERKVAVAPPAQPVSASALPSLWARSKVADLMTRDLRRLQAGEFPQPLTDTVTALGVEYRLMTQFTSFVAVEERVTAPPTAAGPKRVDVPAELPEGMKRPGEAGHPRPAGNAPANVPPVAAVPEAAPGRPVPPGWVPPQGSGPAVAMAQDDPPGGVPNVGTGGDPFKQAMQNSTPDAGTPAGWARKALPRDAAVAAGGGSDGASDAPLTIGVGTGGLGLGTGYGGGTGGGDGSGHGPLAMFGTPGGGQLGPKGPVFGSGGNARTIVFVCDASVAMAGGIDALRAELLRAINGLKPIQRFNVIFSRDGKAEAATPQAAPATADAKRVANEFVAAVRPEGASDPTAALEQAFAQRPHLVYLLSSGRFEDDAKVLRRLRELNADKRVKVNTIAFAADAAADERLLQTLKTIATENGGAFRVVRPADVKE